MSDFELVNIWNIYIKEQEKSQLLEVSVHTGQSELVKVQVNKYELKNNTLKKQNYEAS